MNIHKKTEHITVTNRMMKCDTEMSELTERGGYQTQVAFSCVAHVIPEKYNISPFRFMVNLPLSVVLKFMISKSR